MTYIKKIIRKGKYVLPIFILRFWNLFYELIYKDFIILTASVHPFVHNWGDDMSKKIVEFIIPNKKILIRKFIYNIWGKNDYACVGSIITWMTTSKTIIWGSGVVYPQKPISAKPKKVLAVRGPLTRKYLLEKGIDCPEIYGDPALLFPRFYQPQTKEKKYKLGIIPHMRDNNNKIVKSLKHREDLLILNMRDINPWTKVIDQINQCEHIISSSLHGIILADAYQVPNRWVEFEGGEQKAFAFHDYLQSVGHDVESPILVDSKTKIENLINYCKWEPLNIDLDQLMSVCPFTQNNHHERSSF